MLMPSRVKKNFRKMQRGKRKGIATKGDKVSFGSYGLVALESSWITGNQIEASRIAINRNIVKTAKMWIRIFPQRSVTAHPAETRMGKGKGAPDHWVAIVKPGTMMFEIDGVTAKEAKTALALAAAKLPIKTKFISKKEMEGEL